MFTKSVQAIQSSAKVPLMKQYISQKSFIHLLMGMRIPEEVKTNL